MPRPERPLGAAGPLIEFATELRRLRESAGSPGYRELARRAHYSVTTLSDAAGGQKLPSLAVTLAYVRACGGSVEEWEARWHAVAGELTAEGGTEDVPPPYVGLAAFQPEDAHLFFGRERLVDELLTRLENRRFLAVFGASGAGKSSLLRAGLVPRVPTAVLVTPGPHPMRECARHLAAENEVVLVVDQFEEVFTLCADRKDRAEFVTALVAATQAPGSRVKVVLGVRADFYGHCSDHPDLVDALRDAQVLVGPMTTEELRRAVTRPAADMACTVEGSLLAAIVADAAGQPGALPLISHTLREVWRLRRGNTLTLAGYQAVGGVRTALARTAEALYTAFTGDQQRLARDLFLRLTALGDGTEDTRRRISRDELNTGDPDMDTVLGVLAEARLVTLGERTVELAHEALLRAWPRLRRWLAEDRDGLRVHRQLTEAAHTWVSLGRDPGALYRGTRLDAARDWATRGELSPTERAFLDASVRLRDKERAAAARRARVLRNLTSGLAVLLVVAVAAGVVALRQRAEAMRAHRTALSRQLAVQALAMADFQPGTAMLLSAEAFRLDRTTEARGALLSMSAHLAYRGELTAHAEATAAGAVSEVAFSPDGRTLASASADHTVMLWDTRDHTRRAVITEHDTWLRAVTFSPDGRLLATAGDDQNAVLWDVASRERVATLAGHTASIREVAFSPDGSTIATAGADRTVMVWDTRTRSRLAVLTGHTEAVNAVEFSPDGRTMASAGADHTVVLWDVPSRAPRATLTGHTAPVGGVAFSPDGRTLATAGWDNAVMLWDTSSSVPPVRLAGHTDRVSALTFTPDGRTLATVAHDRTVLLWDTASRTLRARLTGHANNIYTVAANPRTGVLATGDENGVTILWSPVHTRLALPGQPADVALSPDGRTAAVTHDTRTTLWDTARRAPLATLTGHTEPVWTAEFTPDGRTLATAGLDQTITLWNVARGSPVTTLSDQRGLVLEVTFSPDGRTMAAANQDGTVTLWDLPRRIPLANLDGHTSAVNGVAFSPDGSILATASHDHRVLLWDVAQRAQLATLIGHTGWITSAAFSPDGRTLATAGLDQRVMLWDVASHTRLATVPGYSGTSNGITFSPDGHTLAFAGTNHTVGLWDTTRKALSARLTGHTQPVTALTSGPANTLLSTAADHTAILWSTDPAETETQICTALARDLTHEEWTQFIPELDYRETCA